MGFKQGSEMARFLVQKEHSGARVEQRTIQWKTWGPLGRRQLLCLREKTGGALGWGSGTRHRERAPFIFPFLLCSGPTLL